MTIGVNPWTPSTSCALYLIGMRVGTPSTVHLRNGNTIEGATCAFSAAAIALDTSSARVYVPIQAIDGLSFQPAE